MDFNEKANWDSSGQRRKYHALQIQYTLQTWLDKWAHKDDISDPQSRYCTYRSIYNTLHDLTSSSQQYFSGMASVAVIDLLERGEITKASSEHFFGGKKFAYFLMGKTREGGKVPELDYIETQIRKKGGCHWVTKSENNTLKQYGQDYSKISQLKRYKEPGEFYLEDDESDFSVSMIIENAFGDGLLEEFYV